MAISVTDAYKAEEAATVSYPITFISIFRTEYTTMLTDDSGTNTNTQLVAGVLSLTGTDDGNWQSSVTDSEFLTSLVVYDLLNWTQTLNGGTVDVYIRTAQTDDGVEHASWKSITKNTLRHEVGFRYYQIKIELTYGSSSPTVEDLAIRYKGMIPPDEYSSIGTIRTGPSVDISRVQVGTCSITVDNSGRQWDSLNTQSYIYDLIYLGQRVEIYSGFDIQSLGFSLSSDEIGLGFYETDSCIFYEPDDIGFDEESDFGTGVISVEAKDWGAWERGEFVKVFEGSIQSLKRQSGLTSKPTATINLTDLLFDKVQKTTLGAPDESGTPQPYIKGHRYRESLNETDASAYTYTIYGSPFQSIGTIYERDTDNNIWSAIASSDYTAYDSNGVVVFTGSRTKTMTAEVVADASVHPVSMVLDILENQIGLNSSLEINQASFNTAWAIDPTLEVSCKFTNTDGLSAIQELLEVCDGTLVIEEGQATIHIYSTSLATADQTFIESNHKGLALTDDLNWLINKIVANYADYEDDTTKNITLSNATSITNYGERTKNYDYTYDSSVSVNSSTVLTTILTRVLNRLQTLTTVVDLNVVLDIIRTQVFDIIDVTDTFIGFSETELLVLNKQINLLANTGVIQGIKYNRGS